MAGEARGVERAVQPLLGGLWPGLILMAHEETTAGRAPAKCCNHADKRVETAREQVDGFRVRDNVTSDAVVPHERVAMTTAEGEFPNVASQEAQCSRKLFSSWRPAVGVRDINAQFELAPPPVRLGQPRHRTVEGIRRGSDGKEIRSGGVEPGQVARKSPPSPIGAYADLQSNAR